MYIDPHIHIDRQADGSMHGLEPRELYARMQLQPRLDGGVILGHDKHLRQNQGVFFQAVADVRALLSEKIILPAVEASVVHEGEPYHVGILFESEYGPYNLPPLPDRKIELWRLAGEYRRDVRCLILLYHPTEYVKDQRQFAITEELMASGLVDGVEILNVGSTLYNPGRLTTIAAAGDLFLSARQKRPNLAPLASSDQHRGNTLGGASTYFHGARHKADIFEAIRAGRTTAVNHRRDLVYEVAEGIRLRSGAGQFIRHELQT